MQIANKSWVSGFSIEYTHETSMGAQVSYELHTLSGCDVYGTILFHVTQPPTPIPSGE
jgi:hypothetical protein